MGEHTKVKLDAQPPDGVKFYEIKNVHLSS